MQAFRLRVAYFGNIKPAVALWPRININTLAAIWTTIANSLDATRSRTLPTHANDDPKAIKATHKFHYRITRLLTM